MDETAMSVGLFSLGSLFALGIFRLKGESSKKHLFLIVLLVFGLFASTVLIFSVPKITLITGLGIILISASLSWVNSFLFSQSSLIGSIEEINRQIQFYSTLAVLAGVSIGPILSGHVSYQNIWVVVSIGLVPLVGLMYFFIFWRLPRLIQSQVVVRKMSPVVVKTKLEIWNFEIYPLVALAIVWFATGFFQVYEVKILVEKFGLDSGGVSAIFALTLVSNLFAVKYISPKIKNHTLSVAISGVIVAVACLLYLLALNLAAVVCLILIIGIFNGLFNVGYTNLILNLSEQSDRERIFLGAKITSQISLVASTVLAAFVTLSHLSVVLFSLVSLAVVLAFLFRTKIEALKSTLLIILITLICTVSDRALAGDITVLVPSIPKVLDPRNISDTTSALIANQVYQKLYRFDENSFLTPELAESIRWSDQLKTLELTIKSDVKFSDGSQLDAKDVVSSLLSIVEMQGDQIAWIFSDVIGFKQVLKTGKYDQLGIKVVDKFKLRFSFSRPNPLFLNFLATPSVYIFEASKLTSKFIGSGAYTIESSSEKSWTLSSSKEVVRKIQFVTPELRKAFDMSSYLPEKIPNYAVELDTFSFPFLQTVVMVFNTKSGRFVDSKLRCELATLFQGTLSDKSFYEWQPVSLGLPFSWDIAKTQKSSDFKGISKNLPLSINVLFANSAAHFSDAINKRATIEFQNKGFSINFKEDSIQNLVKKMKTNDFQIALFGYVPDYPHLDALLTPLVGKDQGYNLSKYSNEKVDKFLSQARTTSARDVQNEAYGQIFEVLAQDCPIGFLGTQEGKILIGKNIVLPRFSSLGFHTINFSKVKFK